MKHILTTLATGLCLGALLGTPEALSQQRNPVLEYCTGTWCQWCPCGHDIIRNQILPNLPKAVIIGYHGPANTTSDPWSTFPGNQIIASLGLSAYPTGNVDRISSAPISRGSWYTTMSNRSVVPATVDMRLSKSYDAATRRLSMSFQVTPLVQLTGQYKLTVILLEDSLIYPQTGNSSCTGGSNYRHDHVVRAMMNGHLGDSLNTSSPWSIGEQVTRDLSYTVPSACNDTQCHIAAFVYVVGGTLSTSEIQQADQWKLAGSLTDAEEKTPLPASFGMAQNYPNPFNPMTTIAYALPKPSVVSLKVFDMLGREVATLAEGMKWAGGHFAVFDASKLTSGVYVYTLTAGAFTSTKKMLLVK